MLGKSAQYFPQLFFLNDTPERISLAFSLGVLIAFSPFLGLHTVLGLVFSLIFGLNRIALLLGVFVNNPWTLVPIYTAGTYLGGLFVGFPKRTSLPKFEWSAFFSGHFYVQLFGQWQILKPLLLGSCVLSIIAAIFSYMLVLNLIKNYRANQA
jgi:uncharacterized protein